jgi:hypothetical protein
MTGCRRSGSRALVDGQPVLCVPALQPWHVLSLDEGQLESPPVQFA